MSSTGGVRREDLTLDDAKLGTRTLLATVVVRDFEADVAVRAIELAYGLGQPASYDAPYLALTEREGCEYWNADERLWNAARGILPWVRWVGECHLPGP